MPTIIPIAGKAEAGKDASAIIIKELLEEKGFKVCIVHYGDYLKYICSQYLGWDGVKDDKGRDLLQYEGTEHVRKIDFDFWTNAVYNFVRVYKDRFDVFLIPDTRFPNEANLFKDKFITITLKIVRLNYENTLNEEQRDHMSETSLDDYIFDKVIESESGLNNLRAEIEPWVKEVFYG